MFPPTSLWYRFLNRLVTWHQHSSHWWQGTLAWLAVTFVATFPPIQAVNNNKSTNTPLVSVAQTRSRPSPNQALHELLELLSQQQPNKSKNAECSDEFVLETMQSSLNARWWASLVMIPPPQGTPPLTLSTDLDDNPAEATLVAQLRRLWPQLLLQMDSTESASNNNDKNYKYNVSLIVPAFRENPIDLLIVLTRAWKHAANAKKIQVVLVDAGGHEDLADTFDDTLHTRPNQWGSFEIVEHRGGGGRGGCLNAGAQQAQGRVLTFLHADTLLPEQWDRRVLECLSSDTTSTTNACAFEMGIDTRRLTKVPPGLAGAVWQGRLRRPYGDSALSIKASVFDYLGGYPQQQPLLEDVALVQLLDQRARVLGNHGKQNGVTILPGPGIECSPRRWQALGVPYVALSNWTLLRLYQQGVAAEDLYELYYGTSVGSGSTSATTTSKKEEEPEPTVTPEPISSEPLRSTEDVKSGSHLYRATAQDLMQAYHNSSTITTNTSEEKKKDK